MYTTVDQCSPLSIPSTRTSDRDLCLALLSPGSLCSPSSRSRAELCRQLTVHSNGVPSPSCRSSLSFVRPSFWSLRTACVVWPRLRARCPVVSDSWTFVTAHSQKGLDGCLGPLYFQRRSSDLHHPLKYLQWLKEAPRWHGHSGYLGYIIIQLEERGKFFITTEGEIIPRSPKRFPKYQR